MPYFVYIAVFHQVATMGEQAVTREAWGLIANPQPVRGVKKVSGMVTCIMIYGLLWSTHPQTGLLRSP